MRSVDLWKSKIYPQDGLVRKITKMSKLGLDQITLYQFLDGGNAIYHAVWEDVFVTPRSAVRASMPLDDNGR